MNKERIYNGYQCNFGHRYKNGINADSNVISSALSQLVGNGDSLDIASMVASFSQGGMGDVVSSWLGNGENKAASPASLLSMLGNDKVASFASQLGVSQDAALSGLSNALPEMVDKASPEGSLLDSLGGASGALNMVGKMFG